MKPEELRIGNLVRWDLNDPRDDSEYDEGYTETEVDLDMLSQPDRITPIPLSEEWLKRLGFTEDSNAEGDYVKVSGRVGFIVALSQEKDFSVFYRNDIGLPYHPLPFISYAHQLQNLYFALTGEELTPR